MIDRFGNCGNTEFVNLDRRGVWGIIEKDAMPTVLRIGRFRLVIFSNEGVEPPHIHVKSDRNEAKFWLDPVALAANYGFKAHELHEIRNIVREHQNELMEAWHEHLG